MIHVNQRVSSAWLNRLRALRLQRGLTQGQLARLLGVTDQTVHRWEVGTVPRKAMQRRIARVLLGSATEADELGFD
jgi:transcriptional regulator with XRE-family HTH domain